MSYQILSSILVGLLVVGCILWQIISCLKINNIINIIKNLFPTDVKTLNITSTEDVNTISCDNANKEFGSTLDNINKYLSKNKNKTVDYQIVKEVVERESQSLEEEVETMLQSPLYIGLLATICGIIIGVILLAVNGIEGILSESQLDYSGIQGLLIDVGIAMLATLGGVFSTNYLTSKFNAAKAQMSKNKNVFLTWIQSELMSKLNDDITGAILKMTNDLNEFNSTFADNTKELRHTLQTVNSNYEGQVKLLEAVEKIKITKIAKANIEVYDKLQSCTEELEKLFMILANSESYIEKVIELNRNIGTIEDRTRLFENLGVYFQSEIEYVKDRQGYMRREISGLDSVLQDALSNLGEDIRQSLQQLAGVFNLQNSKIQELIETQQTELSTALALQQQAVAERLGVIEDPFSGLKEMFEAGIHQMNEAFLSQNIALEEMLHHQKQLIADSLKAQSEEAALKLRDIPSQLQTLEKIAGKLSVIVSHFEDSDGQPGGPGRKFRWLEPIALFSILGMLIALFVVLVIKF